MADKQTKDLAKKLVELSLDKREVSSEKVSEVIETLSANPPRKHKALLASYKKFIEREIAKYTAKLEHAGPISKDALSSVQTFLENNTGRNIQVQTKENQELLAGIRVTLADDVYEDSASFRLRPLTEGNL